MEDSALRLLQIYFKTFFSDVDVTETTSLWTLIDDTRDRIKSEWPEIQEFATNIHPLIINGHERVPICVVVMHVAVDNPPVPIIGNILRPMCTIERVVVMIENTRIKHREWCLLWLQSHIVVTSDQQITVESLEVLDRFPSVLHIHRDIAQMDQDGLIVNCLVMTVQQCIVHGPDARERPVAVFDDVRMAEMMIRNNVSAHSTPDTYCQINPLGN
ncbi:hypothetical protein AArcS_1717 [Natranaeroarchaeum sulfidigenes]|uniref:Uncharacterized protein n=1 Tax=Natranaeroarchaeum sulfidigenes TaxID=2784880 RepID=A0A897MQW3_9EURY|nr:hypothetical protein AArcS_1717 [Natranaeroarchaeum sulfidigenes]